MGRHFQSSWRENTFSVPLPLFPAPLLFLPFFLGGRRAGLAGVRAEAACVLLALRAEGQLRERAGEGCWLHHNQGSGRAWESKDRPNQTLPESEAFCPSVVCFYQRRSLETEGKSQLLLFLLLY